MTKWHRSCSLVCLLRGWFQFWRDRGFVLFTFLSVWPSSHPMGSLQSGLLGRWPVTIKIASLARSESSLVYQALKKQQGRRLAKTQEERIFTVSRNTDLAFGSLGASSSSSSSSSASESASFSCQNKEPGCSPALFSACLEINWARRTNAWSLWISIEQTRTASATHLICFQSTFAGFFLCTVRWLCLLCCVSTSILVYDIIVRRHFVGFLGACNVVLLKGKQKCCSVSLTWTFACHKNITVELKIIQLRNLNQ